MNLKNAIAARQAGVWDDPDLEAFGALGDTAGDITAMKQMWLEEHGFTVGARDPRLNRNYPGAFMVVEAHEESELPTDDGSNGPWCVVGDDLPKMIADAYAIWAEG